MPNYIRITSRGRNNVRVLLEDGTTRVISVEDFGDDWTQISVTPPFEYDEHHYVNPSNPEDRVYIRVLRQSRYNTVVSLPNGAVVKIPNEYFSTWTQGRDTSDLPLCGIYNRTAPIRHTITEIPSNNTEEQPVRRRRGRPRSTEPRGFQNPENQSERLYTSIVRHGSHNISVLTPNGDRVKVPSDLFSTWLMVGSREYYLWEEQENYPNGRSVEDCTFGVELEFIANGSKLEDFCEAMKALVGSDRFICPLRYGRSSKTQWSLTTDSSVQSTRVLCNKSGYELNSPILRFNNECKEELRNVLKVIKSVFGGEINRTCGTHIHVGNFYNYHKLDFMTKVQLFRAKYGELEYSVFDKLVSPLRRFNNNRYCLSCFCTRDESKYYKINTRKLDILGTLENRQHNGTLNINKIWYWMELNGRFMTAYFHNPSLFSDNNYGMEDFFEMIPLSDNAKTFFYNRASELNSD